MRGVVNGCCHVHLEEEINSRQLIDRKMQVIQSSSCGK